MSKLSNRYLKKIKVFYTCRTRSTQNKEKTQPVDQMNEAHDTSQFWSVQLHSQAAIENMLTRLQKIK